MDALIRAWEEGGGKVTAGVKDSDHHFKTAFAIGPDKALVSLAERTEPIPDWKPPKDPWPRRYPPHRPTGNLVFAVHYWRREGLRSTWADGKRQRLRQIREQSKTGAAVVEEPKEEAMREEINRVAATLIRLMEVSR